MADNFKERFSQAVKETETVVYSYLPEETGHQKTIFEAMNYSVKAGGKRLRPLLMREVYRLFGGNGPEIEPFMAAMEMIHTSSLIHDDLPCMDNDDLRRGKPTNHVIYGECTATLAGDALQAEAFRMILSTDLPVEVRAECARLLAEAAGESGICGGQQLDMEGEGKVLTKEELMDINDRKTSAMIHAACLMGVTCGGGNAQQRAAAAQYAKALGLAFQIRDDMLDVISTEAELGKPIGSDAREGKNTFMALYGLERCSAYVHELSEEAAAAVDGVFADSAFLRQLARSLADRKN